MRTPAAYSLVFLGLLFAIPLLMLASKTESISEEEKRRLAEWPMLTWNSYLSGEYFDGIDQYFDDHMPGRSTLIKMGVDLKYSMGFHPNVRERTIVIKPSKPEKGEESKTPRDSAAMNYKADFESTYTGTMLIIDGAVYTYNSGSPVMSRQFAQMLNGYAKKLAGHSRVFSCVAPLSSAFIPVEKYRYLHDRNKATLDAIRDHLDGALFSDVLGEMTLRQNKRLFYGTDHHWNALGAYCGYVAFCRSAGLTPVPLEQMERKVRPRFLGSLYNLTQDPEVRAHPDTLEYFKPRVESQMVRFPEASLKQPVASSVFCDRSYGYMTFICGDAPLVRITTNVKNGKRAAVVKNSMGNAFAVYLISHYEEIWVFDFRYSQHKMLDIIYDREIDDVIFALGLYGAMTRGTIHMMRMLGEGGIGMPRKKEEPDSTLRDDNDHPKPDSLQLVDTVRQHPYPALHIKP